MGTNTSNSNKPIFSMFGPGTQREDIQAKSDDKPSKSASLFSSYTPPKEEPEPKKKPTEFKHDLSEITSVWDLANFDFMIDLDEGENGNIIAEILHAILPFWVPELLGMTGGAELNLAQLLERIQEILQDPNKDCELELELLLEELEKQKKKENDQPKKLRFKIVGNKRQVGLAFQDELDDDNQKARAAQLAKELQALLEKAKTAAKAAKNSSLLGMDTFNNPASMTSEKINFQLKHGGGAIMTVMLGYIMQYLAPAIANTIARGNPHLRGLLTKFDQGGAMSRTVNLAGQNGGAGVQANIQGKGNNVSVELKGSAADVKKLGGALKGAMNTTSASSSGNLWANKGSSSDSSGPSGPSSR